MNNQFTIELEESQLNYINQLLPKNYSFQIYEKVQRRRKAEKKLDDMFVAQFSLRPPRKIKKENQNNIQKNPKTQTRPIKPIVEETLQKKNEQRRNFQSDRSQVISIQKQKPLIPQSGQRQAPVNIQTRQGQIISIRSSRSQRVSKPTEAYIQFQQQNFKRKPAQRVQNKAQVNLGNLFQIQQRNDKVRNQIDRMEVEQKQIQGQKNRKEEQKQKILLRQKQIFLGSQKMKQRQLMVGSQKQKNNQKQKWRQCEDIRQKQRLVILKLKQQSMVKQKQQIIQKPYSLRKDPIKKQFFQNKQTQRLLKKPSPEKEITSKNPQNSNLQEKLNQNFNQPPNQYNHFNNTNSYVKYQLNFMNQNNKEDQKNIAFQKQKYILAKLKIHKFSWPFRQPVNPVAQGVPDYYQKIKNPMDLKTIQKRLNSNYYSQTSQFHYDIKTMFDNSYIYNGTQGKLYNLTSQLQKYYNQIKENNQMKSRLKKFKKEDDYSIQDQNQEDENTSRYKNRRRSDGSQKSSKNERSFNNQNNRQQRSSRRRNQSQIDYQSNSYQQPLGRTSKVVLRSSQGPTRRYNDQIKKQQFDRQRTKKGEEELRSQNQPTLKITKIQMQLQKQSKNTSFKNYNKKPLQQTPKKTLQQSSKNNLLQQSSKKQNNQIKNLNKQFKNQSKPARFGYIQPKISVSQRQILLNDIYSLKSFRSQSLLLQFVMKNYDRYKKYMYNEDIRAQNKQQNMQDKQKYNDLNKIHQQNQRCIDLQLKDLDLQSYRLLRKQMNRLMLGVQQQSRQQDSNKSQQLINKQNKCE